MKRQNGWICAQAAWSQIRDGEVGECIPARVSPSPYLPKHLRLECLGRRGRSCPQLSLHLAPAKRPRGPSRSCFCPVSLSWPKSCLGAQCSSYLLCVSARIAEEGPEPAGGTCLRPTRRGCARSRDERCSASLLEDELCFLSRDKRRVSGAQRGAPQFSSHRRISAKALPLPSSLRALLLHADPPLRPKDLRTRKYPEVLGGLGGL
ncbi:hypothetical protein EV356DRAFT_373451 [Viridothelium virens]|uniref:Uncharacterized protein n=1 Tax=Viridothelium virens TaxID=1048519 RepID=A0A6A6GVF0_VIRVR|nr:hypothetical protein EV356DRAFT_373451 [Viridothelium virens]